MATNEQSDPARDEFARRAMAGDGLYAIAYAIVRLSDELASVDGNGALQRLADAAFDIAGSIDDDRQQP